MGEYLTTDQGVRVDDTDDSLKVGRARPDAARGLPPAREDHALRPRAHPRARRARARRRRPRLLPGLRVAGRATRGPTFLQDPAVKTPGLRALLDRRRLARLGRHGARRARLRDEVLHGRGQLRSGRQQHPGLLHPGRHQVPRPHPRREARAATTRSRRRRRRTTRSGTSSRSCPRSTHMLMWVMSDRAIPRSFRMMEGFGVHTFRLVNARGQVALRQVPLEAAARRALAGVGRGAEDRRQGPRLPPPRPLGRDRGGDFPEWELGVQIIAESDEHTFELRPARRDQARPRGARAGAAHRQADARTATPTTSSPRPSRSPSAPANVVPGIDFTDDPLLQARLFSYLDTQLTAARRAQLRRDPDQPPGRAGATTTSGTASASSASRRAAPTTTRTRSAAAARCSRPTTQGGFVHYPEQVERHEDPRAQPELRRPLQPGDAVLEQPVRRRRRSTSSAPARFELGKVESKEIRERMVESFAHVDLELARDVAEGIGVPAPAGAAAPPPAPPGQADVGDRRPRSAWRTPSRTTIKTRQVAVLVADGVDGAEVAAVRAALEARRRRRRTSSPRCSARSSGAGGTP